MDEPRDMKERTHKSTRKEYIVVLKHQLIQNKVHFTKKISYIWMMNVYPENKNPMEEMRHNLAQKNYVVY